MSIIDEEIIKKILIVDHPSAEIIIKKWDLNRNIIDVGNNYSSAVGRLTIEYLIDGTFQEKRIFVKIPSANVAMYEMGNRMNAFDKEPVMYTEILPEMFAITGEHFYPRCYLVAEKHSLFLEDLSQSGYKMANRLEQLDFEHCYQALKCLARFHGSSVKLRGTKGLPDIIEKDIVINNSEELPKNLRDAMFSGLWKFYDNLDPQIQQKYSEQIKVFKTITWEEIVDECSPANSSFCVLNHGDFWCANMMFKYDKCGILKKVKPLDFQISRWNTPAMDLIHFIISSMRYDVYTEYFDLLLNIYLNTLNKVLNNSDCETYTMEELRKDIARKYKFALMALTCFLPIVMCDGDKALEMDKMVGNENINDSAMDGTYQQKRYLQVATKWFLHFVEKG